MRTKAGSFSFQTIAQSPTNGRCYGEARCATISSSLSIYLPQAGDVQLCALLPGGRPSRPARVRSGGAFLEAADVVGAFYSLTVVAINLSRTAGAMRNSFAASSIASSSVALQLCRRAVVSFLSDRCASGPSLTTRHCIVPAPVSDRTRRLFPVRPRVSIHRPLLGQARQDAPNHRGVFADSGPDLAILGTVAPHCLHSLNSGLLIGVRDELVVNNVKSERRLASGLARNNGDVSTFIWSADVV